MRRPTPDLDGTLFKEINESVKEAYVWCTSCGTVEALYHRDQCLAPAVPICVDAQEWARRWLRLEDDDE